VSINLYLLPFNLLIQAHTHKGKTASQAAHAAVSCFKRALDTREPVAMKWFNLGQPKIVLKVDTEEELESLQKRANDCDLVTSLIRDAGRTQIASNTVTCLGIGPDYDDKIDAIVKDLKLL
jgi:PTH2 family peptidyl-tRNA hydrolase